MVVTSRIVGPYGPRSAGRRVVRVDDVVAGRSTALRPVIGGTLPTTGRRGGAQAVQYLLQIGGQRPHPVDRSLVLDRLPGIGDEHLGAGLVVHRDPLAELG